MEVKEKEMDLLSNSIAVYAHIKGKSYYKLQKEHLWPELLINTQITASYSGLLFVCLFISKPRELWPLLRARSVFRPGADTLPPGHPDLLQATDQHRLPHP